MQRKLLSTWNQVAPRAYVRQWYCFPYRQDASVEALADHLTLVLKQLAENFPDLAGRIFLLSNPKGRLCIGVADGADIVLKVLDQRGSFGWTYAQLKDQGFPAKAFVDSSFDLPYQLREDQDGVPVFEVHARVIDGGLLLCLYHHHSISDGSGMDDHIGSLADLTRDPTKAPEVQYPVDFHVDLPERLDSHLLPKPVNNPFQTLLDLCPEYSLLPNLTGPTQFSNKAPGVAAENIQKTGRIFVIGDQKINALKERIGQVPGISTGGSPPSTFTCLAAITWAHATKARLSSPTKLLSSSLQAEARLMISINWRHRAFLDVMSSSAGNAIALPLTVIDTATLMAACSTNLDAAGAALGTIVGAINAAIRGVDEDYIALRTSLIRSAPDPRAIGLSADPRDPCDFYFNTWRHFGAHTRWKFPGLAEEDSDADGDGGLAPDAVRRAQAGWNMGAGLILPIRDGGAEFEVLVSLEIDAMEILCAEPSWQNWVDEIVE